MTIPLKQMVVYSVAANMPDWKIRMMIVQGVKIAHDSGEGGMITLDGYDQDPREIWQIPEALNFTRKLVAMGVCSILTLTSYLDPRFDEWKPKPWGGFELWLCAKDMLGQTIEGDLLRKVFKEFLVFLGDSNAKAEDVINGIANDGNNKV